MKNRTIAEESALSEFIDHENRTIPEEFTLSEYFWNLQKNRTKVRTALNEVALSEDRTK